MWITNHYLPIHLYLFMTIFVLSVASQSNSVTTTNTTKVTKLKTTATNDQKKSDCPSNCNCGDDNRVVDTLKNPQLVSCSFKSLEVLPSQFPNETTTLDLNSNKITKITLLQNLSNLRSLNLSRNAIDTIEPKSFDQLINLERIDLTLNQLSELPDMLFINLNSLKEIDLSDNKLTKLQENIFDNQQWLEVLNLRANDLKSLPEVLFRNNERLRVLDLSHNMLYSFPDTIFEPTQALTTLDISENQFSIVPFEELARVTKLEELDISANLMKKLDHVSFSNLGSLRVLRINNMKQLTEIDDYTFSDLCSLRILEVTFNPRLSILAHSAFFGLNFNSSCSNLEQVNLYGNQLTTMKEHVLPVCSIPVVDLRNNQWNCDCHFKWVKSCKKDDPIHQQIRCATPSKIASIEISALKESQFTCPSDATTFNREVRSFRLFVILFGVATLLFMGFMVIYHLHKAKLAESRYQRMGSIHYVKATENDGQE